MSTRGTPIVKFDKQYEALTAEILRKFNTHAQVSADERVRGRSGRLRQIDVAVRSTIVGQPIFLAFECKHYRRPVALKQVEELIGKIEDVRAQIGVLVSDSGFDAGAIARAREHGRIQLCQLLDSTQGWLKTKLAVELVVSFTAVNEPYQISFHRIKVGAEGASDILPIDLSFTQDRSFLEDQLIRAGVLAVEDFHRWLAQQLGDLPDGEHQHTVHVSYPNEDGVRWTFTFNRSTETFSKEDVFLAATGLYDTLKGDLTVGSASGFILEETAIRASWNPRNSGYSPRGVDHYRRIGTPSVESAEEIVQNVLQQLGHEI